MARTLFRGLAAAIAIALAPAAALAGGPSGPVRHAGWEVRQPTRWVVSGVLQKNDAHSVIKPVHAILVDDTEDAALADFARQARHDYPEYTLIGTLATRVPDAGRCENSI